MNKVTFNITISSMIIILGFSLAIAGTTLDFKFQSNPTDEQIFTATVKMLKHYRFNISHEDAKALWIRANRDISKETVYDLVYFIEIKEKQIRILANVSEYGPGAGRPQGTVFGKTVSGDTRFSHKWRSDKELHDASWLIGKVIRTIGTRLDASAFKEKLISTQRGTPDVSGYGRGSTLKDYHPKSAEEEAIKMVLVAYESAWNKHDQQGVLTLLHKNGQFMIGRERSMVSKEEYSVYLPTRMEDYPHSKLYEPTISIVGDKASIKLFVDMVKYQSTFEFLMFRENNKWFITGWGY